MVDVPWLRLGQCGVEGGVVRKCHLYETDLSFHHIHDISLKNLLRIDLDLFHISTSSAACAQSVRPLSL